jgi:two-component system OmpR family response regulator
MSEELMPTSPLNRICYVEDDEDIQRIVRMSLERIGKMTVEVVGDPTQAIDTIKTFKPDLVMLDWMMPGMDGPTVFRKMRETPEVQSLPVVFITAKASSAEMDELRAMGAAGAISKPFSPKDLPDQLRKIWSGLP